MSRAMRWVALVFAVPACASPPAPPRAPAPLPRPHVEAPKPVAPPPPAEASEPEDDGEPTSACDRGTPEHREAEQRIEALDKVIMSLAPDANPKPAEDAITAALQLKCLALGAPDAPALDADSGHALKTWWHDEGGKWWLSHYLELTIPRTPNSFPTSVVAPTIRKTLTRETRKGHPLGDLVCPLADASCGLETRGWEHRAERFFERFAEAKHAHWLDGDQKGAPPPSIDTCTAKATEGPADQRYAAWRSCLDGATHRKPRLPLGHVSAPKKGWLFVRGRRGHYTFCDELRAYDLATGAAYVAQSCSGLVLQQGGSVDGASTDRARRNQRSAGTVPLDALREAAWMTMLAPEVQERVAEGWGFALPEGVAPRRANSWSGITIGGSWSTSSAQTTLAWSYAPEGRAVVSGTLRWPEDYNDAGPAHAVELLQVAEAGFTAGCPKALPPSSIDFGGAKGAVSPIDASASSLRQVDMDLLASFAKVRADACAPKTGAARVPTAR